MCFAVPMDARIAAYLTNACDIIKKQAKLLVRLFLILIIAVLLYTEVNKQNFLKIRSKIQQSQDRKLILIYSKFFREQKWMDVFNSFEEANCLVNHCDTTYNKSKIAEADALLFHLRDTIQDLSIPRYRHPRQHWILFSAESSFYDCFYTYCTLTFNYLLKETINRTMTLRLDSDVPVANAYIRPKVHHCQPLEGIKGLREVKQSLQSIRTFNEKKFETKFHDKRRLVAWFVTNCYTQSRRELYVNQLAKFISIDVYGRRCPSLRSKNIRFFQCPKSKANPWNNPCYRMLNRTYKFYLSFENSLCKDYVTEKLWNVLLFDVVPVVYGGGSYEDFLPPNSVINALEYNPQQLSEYLLKLDKNDSLYNSYFAWKDKFEVAMNNHSFNVCGLCEKLFEWENKPHKVYHNLAKWLLKEESCFEYKPFL